MKEKKGSNVIQWESEWPKGKGWLVGTWTCVSALALLDDGHKLRN